MHLLEESQSPFSCVAFQQLLLISDIHFSSLIVVNCIFFWSICVWKFSLFVVLFVTLFGCSASFWLVLSHFVVILNVFEVLLCPSEFMCVL